MSASNGHRPESRDAAIYARVSTEDQGKGYSIPTQIEACQKLAEREGYTVAESHVLIDEGISGTTMDRPRLRRVRDLAKTQAVAAVIVYDPDRLSRKLSHQLLLVEEFERAGVTLEIVSHPMEQGPEGQMLFQMRGIFAEYERAKMMERTERGRRRRASIGHPHGGQVPLGYRYVPVPHRGSWEIDADEALLVQRIFQMCLDGTTAWMIANRLTQEGVPTKRDRDRNPDTKKHSKRAPFGVWSKSSVLATLGYEGYTGRAYYGKFKCLTKTRRRHLPREEWVEFAIPPIITREMFEMAQQQLRRNQVSAPRNRKALYLLGGGRLRCGRCGAILSGYRLSNGKRRYKCSGMARMEVSKRCYTSTKADPLEARVWEAVRRVLEDPELVAREVWRQHASVEARRATLQEELEALDRVRAKYDREDLRWLKAYANESINEGELKGYRAEIHARRQDLETQQQALHAQLQGLDASDAQADALVSYCVRVREQLQGFSFEEQRLALEALDIRVTWERKQPLQIQGSVPIEAWPSPDKKCATETIPSASHDRCNN